MTEAALTFSGDVLSNTSLNKSEHPFMQSLKSFVSTSLASARLVEELEKEDSQDLQNLRSVEPATNGNPAEHGLIRPSAKQNVTTKARLQQAAFPSGVAPRLSLWFPEIITIPFDVRAYMPADTNGPFSFAMLLYWTTLHYAYQAMQQSSSPAIKRLFRYALAVDTSDAHKSRLKYRMAFTPAAIASVLPTTPTLEDQQVESAVNRGEESHILDKNHEKILRAMRLANEDPKLFLSAYAVEQYLLSKWNIDLGLWTTGSGGLQQYKPQSSPQIDLEKIVARLAENSRCLGNGIGFHQAMIDDAVAQG